MSSTLFSSSAVPNGVKSSDSETGQFLAQASSSLLSSGSEIDVKTLERVVELCYNGHGDNQRAANSILTDLKSSETAWLKVDSVLSQTNHHQTRYIALQILEEAIKKRWKSLPQDQCEAIKRYVTLLIISRSMNDKSTDDERSELKRLNTVLVEILKYEWPHRWPSFISDLVKSSLTGESICANNMQILKLLSQEVFDFPSNSLTSAKAQALRASMCTEFAEIFQLCIEVLEKCTKDSLILITLETLLIFLSWIPHGYLFDTCLTELLVQRYMAQSPYRNVAVKLMTEIGSLSELNDGMKQKMLAMFVDSVAKITEMIPDEVDLIDAYNQSHDSEKDFIMNLTMFLSSILSNQHELISTIEDEIVKNSHFRALSMMVRLSRVEETEVFKVCVEFWIFFGSYLADRHVDFVVRGAQIAARVASKEMGDATNLENARNASPEEIIIPFADILSRVRYIMIERMARPEEVVIVETESGEVVREFFKDTDAITLYKNMKECLCNLCYLGARETVDIMTIKLQYQVVASQFNWNGLNTLCWAIGSISGCLGEEEERRFLVYVIKELLTMCEAKRGKDNKAIIAANIMYVVGQHPRFLRAHWKFLKTVCNKLFEFMHESHEGVQDMACDTFLTIATECSHHFVASHPNEPRPFITEIIAQISSVIGELSPQQTQTFYEALGRIIASESDLSPNKKLLVEGSMLLPNGAWEQFVVGVRDDPQRSLKNHLNVSQAINLLKLNRRECRAVGSEFQHQIAFLFESIVLVYEQAASILKHEAAIAIENNPNCKLVAYGSIKHLRSLRHELLGLFRDWMTSCEMLTFGEKSSILENASFIEPLFAMILSDYANSPHPDLREPEVLTCCSCYVRILGKEAKDRVFEYLGSVFETTLGMINKNYEDYPDFRLALFEFLLSVLEHSFEAILRLTQTQFQYVYDSFIYALKHTDRNIIELGFDCLIALFGNYERIKTQSPAQSFYRAYFLTTIDQIFTILNETAISTGLTKHANLLMIMFRTLESLPFRIADGVANVELVRNHIGSGLKHAFPQLQEAQIKVIVEGFVHFDQDPNRLKTHIRDFLIEIRRYTGSDTSDLYLEDREHAIAKAAEEKEKRRLAIAASRDAYGAGNAADAVPLVEMDDEDE